MNRLIILLTALLLLTLLLLPDTPTPRHKVTTPTPCQTGSMTACPAPPSGLRLEPMTARIRTAPVKIAVRF